MLKTGGLISSFYNAARCALVYAEKTMPGPAHLTSSKVQYAFLACDLADLCYTAFQAYTKLKDKYGKNNESVQMTAQIAMVALAGGSYLLAKQINPLLAPILDLHAIFPLSADRMKNITLSLGKPMVYELIQACFFTRIILNITSALLSPKDSLLNLANIVFQTGSLYMVSQFQWLRFERIIEEPFQTIQGTINTGGTLETFQKTAKKLQTVFYTRIFNTDLKSQEGKSFLQSIITSTYELSNKLFQGSTWSRFWFKGGIQKDYADISVAPTWSQAIRDCFWINPHGKNGLQYEVKLSPEAVKAASTVTSIEAKIWHEDLQWQHWLPFDPKTKQWFVPGHLVDHKAWTDVKI